MDIYKELINDECVWKNVPEKYLSVVEKKRSQSSTVQELCNSIVDLVDISEDYEIISVKIFIDHLHAKIKPFNEMCKDLYKNNIFSKKHLTFVEYTWFSLNKIVDLNRDYNFSYFGLITIFEKYLCRIENSVVEIPQYMWLRTAIQIHETDIDKIIETYNSLSNKEYIHASPTLFNSCLRNNQLSSCFLVNLLEDSMDGILETLKVCSKITKYGGGIGVSFSELRSSNSIIESTQNKCKGVMPVLKITETLMKYIDQGGRRKGALCVYFEPWHGDIETILESKRNVKSLNNEYDIHDLFFALWVPDLFMQRVRDKKIWSLFDKKEAEILHNCYGQEFENNYIKFEKESRYVKQIQALDLFNKILVSQIETGGPFMVFKDTSNKLSNQKNVGILKCSNLCTEILEICNSNLIGVCNLASINLGNCFIEKEVDFEKLSNIVTKMVINLNKTIDNTYYCDIKAKTSNLQLRPIGIGVQGLQDLFFKLKISFDSSQARKINRLISEYLYFYAIKKSCDIAKNKGKSYQGFEGSPLSQGIFHHEEYGKLFNVNVETTLDWESLRNDVKKYGVYNSLFIAFMPTASTSQIVGTYESFEPHSGNIISRRTIVGSFKIVNKYLQRDLGNKWNEQIIDRIISDGGSVKNVAFLTDKQKDIYKTIWEIPIKNQIEMILERAPFIDQSQSFSLHIWNPSLNILGNCHFKTWKEGLKTGMYYLRSQPSVLTKDYCNRKCDSCN